MSSTNPQVHDSDGPHRKTLDVDRALRDVTRGETVHDEMPGAVADHPDRAELRSHLGDIDRIPGCLRAIVETLGIVDAGRQSCALAFDNERTRNNVDREHHRASSRAWLIVRWRR